MITYEAGIERYIKTRLVRRKDLLLTQKDAFLFLLPRFCKDDNKRNLATLLTNKVFLLFEELWGENTSLQSTIASLRYIIEALIQTKLLCKEENYFEKIYYSVLKHQINKYEVYIKKIKLDLDILDEYEKKENFIKKSYNCGDLNKITESMKKVDDLYDKLDEELTVSLDAAEFYSISYQKELLKNEFIPAFEKKIHDMEKNYKKICKELAKDCDLIKNFK